MPECINLGARRSSLPFSDAVATDKLLFLSGRIGFTPGTTTVPADPAEEARYMLDGFVAVLREASLTMHDLVYVQIFTPDVSLFDTFNAVYTTYFTDLTRLPARAFLGSGPLLFGARFEMIAIASRE